ncbi:MAG: hypothetical protein U5N86_07155 [Planctomycetota bacterium]|nr:hypothetical protein [Planctomycetota bacterium]
MDTAGRDRYEQKGELAKEKTFPWYDNSHWRNYSDYPFLGFGFDADIMLPAPEPEENEEEADEK